MSWVNFSGRSMIQTGLHFLRSGDQRQDLPYILKINSRVSWRTKKQHIISRSSVEAEYITLSYTTLEQCRQTSKALYRQYFGIRNSKKFSSTSKDKIHRNKRIFIERLTGRTFVSTLKLQPTRRPLQLRWNYLKTTPMTNKLLIWKGGKPPRGSTT